MLFFADLHLHSRFSIATSKYCSPELFDLWARKKGISVLGTADALHPEWARELEKKLFLCENGLYMLKDEFRHDDCALYFGREVYFFVATEVCCIYKWDKKVRRIHLLILLSSLDAARKVSRRLELFGNVSSNERIAVEYEKCVRTLGSEMEIILTLPLEYIKKSSPELAALIEQLRNGNVTISPGYDGKFGSVLINV